MSNTVQWSTNFLILHAVLMNEMSQTRQKTSRPPQKSIPRIMKQYKRRRGNPARSNRHVYAMKDMKSW
jgi:hypothetical protein